MSKILHIEASPRGDRSGSSRLATWFLDACRKANPDDTIETLNVFEADLPTFRADAAHAKFAPIFQEEVSEEQSAIWEAVKQQISHFDAHDKIVLSCPMWNYSVPWALKAYIDVLVQPILTFGYDFEKMVHLGLLRNRPVQLLLTRSSTPPGAPNDFQLPYLRHIFGSIGLNDIRQIVAWQTTQPSAEARGDYIASFRDECEKQGAAF
ncbi:MAG: FMN-dependent NADH-azoreductase [Myxococcota bacterium]